MTHSTSPGREFLSGSTDAIRIVPLHLPEALTKPTNEAGAATPPQLTYRNGQLLTNVEVFTVFWGPAWNSAPASGILTQVNSFFDDILTGPLIDQLNEYSVPGYKIGHGKRTGTVTITTPHIGKSVSDHAIRVMLQHAIATNHAFPPAGPNTLYFIYIPPGTAVVQGGSRSCQAFCGYHDNIMGKIFYAVMPYPGCSGCTGGLPPIDALTSTSSHELCEAITDPVPGQGWYDDVNGENGDICAWKTKKIGTHTVQLEWSNKANSCV